MKRTVVRPARAKPRRQARSWWGIARLRDLNQRLVGQVHGRLQGGLPGSLGRKPTVFILLGGARAWPYAMAAHRRSRLPAFSNSRMILKQVWVGKGTEVGSELLSRGFRCGDGEGGGGVRGRGKLCRVVLRARKLVELPSPPPIPEESRADRPVSGRCLTTVTGSPPAVFSCVAASAARTRCRSSGVLVAREKRP